MKIISKCKSGKLREQNTSSTSFNQRSCKSEMCYSVGTVEKTRLKSLHFLNSNKMVCNVIIFSFNIKSKAQNFSVFYSTAGSL